MGSEKCYGFCGGIPTEELRQLYGCCMSSEKCCNFCGGIPPQRWRGCPPCPTPKRPRNGRGGGEGVALRSARDGAGRGSWGWLAAVLLQGHPLVIESLMAGVPIKIKRNARGSFWVP